MLIFDLKGVGKIGRCDRIRTYDPFTPSEVRYQAAPHTDRATYYMDIRLNIYFFLRKQR